MPSVTWDQRAEDLAYANREADRIMAMSDDEIRADPGFLLEWMSGYHLPLQLWQECEDDGSCWVVVDSSTKAVLGSGGSAHEALIAAYKKSETG